MKDILSVTVKIREEFPEFYMLLEENPLFYSYSEKNITIIDLKQYLAALTKQFNIFEALVKNGALIGI